MAVKKVTIRQIKAAEAELRRKINQKLNAKMPNEPTWDEDRMWQKKHPSPRDRYFAKRVAAKKPLDEKANAILHDAKMERITPDELYQRVNDF